MRVIQTSRCCDKITPTMKINKVCDKLIRPVFSAPLLMFRKIYKGGFVSGLVFGAIFSLAVNVVTIQVQEVVQKQRVFESLEYEIVGHLIQANGTIESSLKKIDQKEIPNVYYSPRRYSREVWGTSEALKYIVQLDPNVQPQITTYYTYLIDGYNDILTKDNNLMEQKLSGCYLDFDILDDQEQEKCIHWYQTFLSGEVGIAEKVSEDSYKLLEVFHPTRDRLNNPILKLLIGKKAVGALSER